MWISVDISRFTGVHIGQLKKAYKMLKSAKKPLILAGGGVNISHAGEKLKKFMEKENVPVVTTIMGKGESADHTSAVYRKLWNAWKVRSQYGSYGM